MTICDCERGHNGLGMAGRECDCQPSPQELAGFALRMVVERIAFRIDAMNERGLPGVSISKRFATEIINACERGARLLENPEPAQAGLTAGGGSGSANVSEGVTGGGERAVGDAAGEIGGHLQLPIPPLRPYARIARRGAIRPTRGSDMPNPASKAYRRVARSARNGLPPRQRGCRLLRGRKEPALYLALALLLCVGTAAAAQESTLPYCNTDPKGVTACSRCALKAGGILPDQQCTPGAVATTDRADIVGKVDGLTYTKRHRVWRYKEGTLIEYGLSMSEAKNYEDDDRVPVCLGGANDNPKNHWPQGRDADMPNGWGYETKDQLDAGACRLVKEGKVSVTDAQAWFLAPDWRPGYCAYKRMAGESDPRCASISQ